MTITPSATADPATALPQLPAVVLPSPTPFRYTIRAGDTLGGIADKFSVDVDALMAANPDVNPNAMSVGKTILIPSSPKNPTGESTPTPAPFTIQQVACHPTADGALWCFALAYNDSPDLLENVTAQFTMLDASGRVLESQMALLPLDVLPSRGSLPLSVLFSPGLPAEARPQVQVLTAMRLLPGDPRYLDAAVQNTQVQVDWSGRSAQASGEVLLPVDSKPAGRIWIAAVVYDADGRVTGVHRWEAGTGLEPGSRLPFSFPVASVAGTIARVDFTVEARP